MGTHRLPQGWNNGQLVVGWLADILSQADHRQSAVRDWANGMPHTLEPLRGYPIREGECSAERLGGVLSRRCDDETWDAIERDLWAATVAVYALERSGMRLDRTTSYGSHQVTDEGVRQRGQSQDHRPDLPHLQLMAAAAEPSGHLSACEGHPGQCAADPLYTPLIQRVRGLMGRTGLRYAGDCKRAALATRAESAASHDYSLGPLPRTGDTADQCETWVTARGDGPQEATLLWDGERLRGAGSECERPVTATVHGQPVHWRARVQGVRSRALAQRQEATREKYLAAAEAALRALTPAPGRGKRQIHDAATWGAAIASILARYDVTGRLTVGGERYETTVTHYVGRGRGGPHRLTRMDEQVRDVITAVQRHEPALATRRARLGWRVQVTNAPVDQRSLPQAVRHYRGGWSLERNVPLVQALPLGLSPLLVWKEDQSQGLTRRRPIALRLLTRLETQGRQELAQAQDTVIGLYEGQPTRTTERPTGARILKAFARAQITLTHVERGTRTGWHLTPLSPLHEQLLRYLHLPTSLYTALVYNSS